MTARAPSAMAVVVLVVGPEGGWSPAECQAMDDDDHLLLVPDGTTSSVQQGREGIRVGPVATTQRHLTCWNVSLGPTIHRIETATLTALAA